MGKVIKAENLSKIYRLGLVGRGTLGDDLNRLWSRIRGKEDPFMKVTETNNRERRGNSEYVWALNDINFEVNEGERFGIIGKNGAGKSTLLKILSRVASPTKGSVKIKGRIASLLEVGTGFHPELTGRDNIFLNGAILGMTQSEIKRKFDSIVDFSGVERYIDTPVKRYSSGMYVRLAFAVAAHLEPEILIVDEVLAVGDSEFQKKCIGKMQDVSENEGRTVLFVSHNLQAIKNLCQNTVILNNGELFSSGPTDETLKIYNKLVRDIKIDAGTEIDNKLNRRGSGAVRFTSIEVVDERGNSRYRFEVGEKVRFKIAYSVFKELNDLTVIVGLLSGLSRECLTLAQYDVSKSRVLPGTSGEIMIEFEDLNIKPGEYPLYFELIDSAHNAYSKDVLDDLTHPLVVTLGDEPKDSGFDPSRASGFFILPSKMLVNEITSEGKLRKAL